LPGPCAKPETVNFDQPPAKLLDRLYRNKLNRGYRKTIDGADLFQRLSPDKARNKCPYLKKLLDQMLALAKDAEQAAEQAAGESDRQAEPARLLRCR
jgi:hypothetical protein